MDCGSLGTAIGLADITASNRNGITGAHPQAADA